MSRKGLRLLGLVVGTSVGYFIAVYLWYFDMII